MTSDRTVLFSEFAKRHAMAPSSFSDLSTSDRDLLVSNLPGEIVDFYSACNGGVAIGHHECVFRFFPFSKSDTARKDIYGSNDDSYGVSWAMAFCKYSESDILAYDLRQAGNNGSAAIYDCWHESFANEISPPIIAKSLHELISRFMADGITPYWLNESRSGGTPEEAPQQGSKVGQALPDRSSE